MNSAEIQAAVYNWALGKNFTAPYGVLQGEHKSKAGKPYKSVTFGRARTLDCSVEIYNRGFIIVRTNRHGNQVCKSYDELMAHLETL
jgi:hypothetical protein